LLRIPNVFTAFANVVAGVCLVRGGSFQLRDIALVLASGALYSAGMVWNDYYDREVDAHERPDRPIPAGEISETAALLLGTFLLLSGLGLAAWHGLRPLLVAAALAAAILLYDASMKSTPFGPLSMGVCRALNVLLGLSAGDIQQLRLGLLPLALGIFTLLITQLSRHEVFGAAPERLRGTLIGLSALAGAVGLAWVGLAMLSLAGWPSVVMAAAVFGYVLWRGRQLFVPLESDVTPGKLGRAIGGGILMMPALDATFVAASGLPLAAAAVLAFTLPALLLKRWYYLT
jgi:4-hydroxybenzoate polyprenyltransferase